MEGGRRREEEEEERGNASVNVLHIRCACEVEGVTVITAEGKAQANSLVFLSRWEELSSSSSDHQLGCHRPLPLQLRLVPFKRLLSAIF
jgi:hypothetical protein